MTPQPPAPVGGTKADTATLLTIFRTLPPDLKRRIQDKAAGEHMSICAVMTEWSSLYSPLIGAQKARD
jgi:hypothetical protein